MAPSRRAVCEQLAALSTDEARAFVADLFAARGWTVDRRQTALRIRRSEGAWRTVALVEDYHEMRSSVDTVVVRDGSVAPPSGVSVLDVDDLSEQLLYALEPSSRDRLLAEHFGSLQERSASNAGTASLDESDELDAETTTAHRTVGGPRTRRAVLIGAGAIVGAAGALLGADIASGPSIRAPGIDRSGVVDAAALAAGHAATIEDRSYSIGYDRIRSAAESQLSAAVGMELSLDDDRSYVTTVSTAGPDAPGLLGEPPATAVFWGNGEEFAVDHSPGTDTGTSLYRPVGGFSANWMFWAHSFPFGGVLGGGPADFYRELFRAVPTRLVDATGTDDQRRYRLVSTRD